LFIAEIVLLTIRDCQEPTERLHQNTLAFLQAKNRFSWISLKIRSRGNIWCRIQKSNGKFKKKSIL